MNTPNLLLAFLSKRRPIFLVVLLSLLSRAPNPRAFKGQPRSWQLGSPLAQRDKRGLSAIITGFLQIVHRVGVRASLRSFTRFWRTSFSSCFCAT